MQVCLSVLVAGAEEKAAGAKVVENRRQGLPAAFSFWTNQKGFMRLLEAAND